MSSLVRVQTEDKAGKELNALKFRSLLRGRGSRGEKAVRKLCRDGHGVALGGCGGVARQSVELQMMVALTKEVKRKKKNN